MANRREFFANSAKLLCLCASGGLLAALATQRKDKYFLRPPGAEDEERFLSLCIRCGLCVDACPYDTLKLANLTDLAQNGTPFFEARQVPCYLCDDIPCIKECPTNALDDKYLKKPKGVFETKMGIAIVDTTHCLAHWGLQCDACYRACPLIDKALRLETKHNERSAKHVLLLPTVDNDICTGCGKCERACITEKASITVMPRDFVLGRPGPNYVKGWDEADQQRLQNAIEWQKDYQREHKDTKQNQGAIDYLNTEDLL